LEQLTKYGYMERAARMSQDQFIRSTLTISGS
jgi:hypothetical protein